jgi:hypothetical protein
VTHRHDPPCSLSKGHTTNEPEPQLPTRSRWSVARTEWIGAAACLVPELITLNLLVRMLNRAPTAHQSLFCAMRTSTPRPRRWPMAEPRRSAECAPSGLWCVNRAPLRVACPTCASMGFSRRADAAAVGRVLTAYARFRPCLLAAALRGCGDWVPGRAPVRQDARGGGRGAAVLDDSPIPEGGCGVVCVPSAERPRCVIPCGMPSARSGTRSSAHLLAHVVRSIAECWWTGSPRSESATGWTRAPSTSQCVAAPDTCRRALCLQ